MIAPPKILPKGNCGVVLCHVVAETNLGLPDMNTTKVTTILLEL